MSPFVVSGMLYDEKENITWTFHFDNERIIFAPTQEGRKEDYSASGMRLLKVLEEFDPEFSLSGLTNKEDIE